MTCVHTFDPDACRGIHGGFWFYTKKRAYPTRRFPDTYAWLQGPAHGFRYCRDVQ